ncbi:MAG: hypothetical protein LUH58_02990, partial [Lachnospiraceae bacterium]|nr:hypothetical protein [Lachnospiraceae bacterium]
VLYNVGRALYGLQKENLGGRRLSRISRISPVIPSACGRNEIYHLKVLLYCTGILARVFPTVKNFSVFDVVIPSCPADCPCGKNGAFEHRIVN